MIITSDNAFHIDPPHIIAVVIFDDKPCKVLLSSGAELIVSTVQANEINDQWAEWISEAYPEDDEVDDDPGDDDDFNDAEITIEVPISEINSVRDMHELEPVRTVRRRK